jgi:hypothetical protein
MFGLLAGNVRDGGERVTEMSGGPLHAVSEKKIKLICQGSLKHVRIIASKRNLKILIFYFVSDDQML